MLLNRRSRVLKVLNCRGVERITRHVILDNYCWLIKGKAQSTLEHDVWTLPTDITHNHRGIIQVLNDALMDDPYIISVTDQVPLNPASSIASVTISSISDR